jgi:hypothetical protein
MPSQLTDAERLAAIEKFSNEWLRYLELFKAAFEELHANVVRQVRVPSQYT